MAKEAKIKKKALNDLIDVSSPFVDDFFEHALEERGFYPQIKLARDAIIAGVIGESMAEGGRFNLANGLPATIYRLDNPRMSRIIEIIRSRQAKETKPVGDYFVGQLRYVLDSLNGWEEDKHYIVVVRIQKAKVYLIYLKRKHPMRELLLLRQNLPSGLCRAFAIVYEDAIHRAESQSGRMLLKAILKKTNPKITALMG
jgi:hypothetical protein